MSCLPNMTVLAPGDPIEARLGTRAMLHRDGPCYLRLGRSGEPPVHEKEFEFEIGKAVTVRHGSDLTFITTGGMLNTAVEAAGKLSSRDISAAVLSMHTVKPLDADAVREAARSTGCILSLEEHSQCNGLGTAIADVLANSSAGSAPCLFTKLAVPDRIIKEVGDQRYLRRLLGDPVERAIRLLEKKRSRVRSADEP